MKKASWQSEHIMETLYIKNMVCDRCKIVVSEIFRKAGFEIVRVEMGKVSLLQQPTAEQIAAIGKALENVGFEIIDDNRSKIIESIKKTIIEMVRDKLSTINVKYSVYLEEVLGKDYNYLSNLFSSSEGQTIEKYIIAQKIERAKELIVYQQMNLSEIAFELDYSSVAHLSNQFKKVTGLTPSHFRKIGVSKRKSLDSI